MVLQGQVVEDRERGNRNQLNSRDERRDSRAPSRGRLDSRLMGEASRPSIAWSADSMANERLRPRIPEKREDHPQHAGASRSPATAVGSHA